MYRLYKKKITRGTGEEKPEDIAAASDGDTESSMNKRRRVEASAAAMALPPPPPSPGLPGTMMFMAADQANMASTSQEWHGQFANGAAAAPSPSGCWPWAPPPTPSAVEPFSFWASASAATPPAAANYHPSPQPQPLPPQGGEYYSRHGAFSVAPVPASACSTPSPEAATSCLLATTSPLPAAGTEGSDSQQQEPPCELMEF